MKTSNTLAGDFPLLGAEMSSQGWDAKKRVDEYARVLEESVAALRAERISPASRTSDAICLLDSFSLLQEQLRQMGRDLSAAYVKDLERGERCEPRVWSVACRIVEASQGVLNSEALANLSGSFQQDYSLLSSAELWALKLFIQLALMERLVRALRYPVEDGAVVPLIQNLRAVEHIFWGEFVESVSATEQALRQDPARVYSAMDFAARDKYRHAVEVLARSARRTEAEVAQLACSLASAAAEKGDADSRLKHVGYYLLGPGLPTLRRVCGCRWTLGSAVQTLVHRWPGVLYVGSISLVTAAIWFLFLRWTGLGSMLVALLAIIPASQAAIEIVNLLVSRLIPPRGLPSLDFSEGIPDDCRTMVVVPTLLFSKAGVEKLLEDLEIRYLANRDRNLPFGLLTDLPDAAGTENEPPQSEAEQELVALCAEGIRRLNRRYGRGGLEPFYLFHRRRTWNPTEGVWMGYERKRGKLNDFNDLLLGKGNRFETIAGNLNRLGRIRYVITLDTDTQLPRDTARKLVATMAHPLNRAIVDPRTHTVREGYAILQPRVAISMQSSGRSRLAQIFSGQTGFDLYSTAFSDVYQDLFGRASFSGKGIYDVEAFAATAGDRFPENTILSHDLIEGEHARTGLVTAADVIDDYPASYQGYSKRKHRWTRGDWQIAQWLLRWVPGRDGQFLRNPLPLISRWKIFDNLRRSLYEVSLFSLLIVGWLVAPDVRVSWTLAVFALMVLPVYANVLVAVTGLPDRRLWPEFLRTQASNLALGHRDALVNLLFLPHQALLMADAVVRTLVRRFITKRRRLEWETMAQSESSGARGSGIVDRYLSISSVLAGVLLLTLAVMRTSLDLTIGLCAVWIACPLLVGWFNAPYRKSSTLEETERLFLRDTALRTWRYFADYANEENHWLIPDFVQEEPAHIEHKISPTNLGLQLTAALAARDLGYIGLEHLAENLERTFDTMRRLPREHGHFVNWYSTNTLQPLTPRFISSVDSGNLCASLCTLRQGLLELLKQPIIGAASAAGCRDYALRLRDEIPYEYRSPRLMRLFENLIRPLEFEPSDLFAWDGLLADVEETAERACAEVQELSSRFEQRGEARIAAELAYWQRAFLEMVRTTSDELHALAPWLDSEISFELRVALREGWFAETFAELSRIPSLAGYAEYSGKLEASIRALLNGAKPVYPHLQTALQKILDALPESRTLARNLASRLENVASLAGQYLEATDFRFLYNKERKLLSGGYDLDNQVLVPYCYDLLASEARTAIFMAIAKGDISREAWFQLGRKLTLFANQRTLVSWSGTMFEYLMPALFMRSYDDTLLDRSLRAAVQIQRIYARSRGIPWGISEAAHAEMDSQSRYQYHAFGVPPLSSKSHMPQDPVVAPYATMLALPIEPAEATRNLTTMAGLGWRGRYGFYESADYRRAGKKGEPHLVKSYMAHHQGMSLAALANTLLDMGMQERFHLDPAVQATEYLLQERIPTMVEAVSSETEPEMVPAPVPPETVTAAA